MISWKQETVHMCELIPPHKIIMYSNMVSIYVSDLERTETYANLEEHVLLAPSVDNCQIKQESQYTA